MAVVLVPQLALVLVGPRRSSAAVTSASLEERGIVRSSAVGFGPRVGQDRVVQFTRGPWGVLRRLQRRRSDAVGVRERCCHMCSCELCAFSSSCCVGRGGRKMHA